jgi:EPS-associated MarR family transcriptional regulator
MFSITLRSPLEHSAPMLTDEYRYKILKILETTPEVSQRELARKLNISLGKANFCLKALVEKGLLKISNFRDSKNKRIYMYLLTRSGIEEKASITKRFLKQKIHEHELLLKEIETLRRESSVTTYEQDK